MPKQWPSQYARNIESAYEREEQERAKRSERSKRAAETLRRNALAKAKEREQAAQVAA